MSTLDSLDQRILALLRADARRSVADIARRLGVARTTVQARIERLERAGVILGYTLRLGPGAERGRLRATVLVQLEPRAAPALLARLKAIPEVELVHTTSGRFDLLIEIGAPDPEALDRILDEIGAIPGVRSSESLIHLTTRLDRRG